MNILRAYAQRLPIYAKPFAVNITLVNTDYAPIIPGQIYQAFEKHRQIALVNIPQVLNPIFSSLAAETFPTRTEFLANGSVLRSRVHRLAA